MGNFTLHTVESSPAPSRDAMNAVGKKFGFIPNLIRELAAAPAAVNAYVTLNGIFDGTSLTPVERQIVLVTTSVENTCEYCVAAHTAGLKMAGLADDQIEAVRERRPLANPKLDALRRLTTAVVNNRGWIGDADLEAFLQAGYSREQVLEVLVGVAMKTLSNYANHIAQTPLDKQFEAFAWAPAMTNA
ncbi:MAG: carboxymuconolactone decarboxylase family protein [Acidobacteria bacterium]|nr:carboxymuconolactone decarboxylase family protein [Acidobacteriota bacterium]